METKLDQLKQMWAAGDCRGALKLAASWPRLGEHKERITRGWAAVTNPDFYRGMGKDPDALYADGLAAVAERYDLDLFECDQCAAYHAAQDCPACGGIDIHVYHQSKNNSVFPVNLGPSDNE